MSGYVYKITNTLNGMWYIGSHNGKNPNYMGSGLRLKSAIKKYGKDAFTKEILYEGEDYRAHEETMLAELNAAKDPSSYNLKNEALGGSFPGELNGMFGRKLDEAHRHQCGSAFRGKKRPEHSEKMAGSGNPMFGKSDHTYGLISRARANTGKTVEEIFGVEEGQKLREKLSESHLGKRHRLKLVTCPKCGKSGKGPNMTRYHFDNCRKL